MSDNIDTPVVFAREEAAQIRDMLTKPNARVLCPLCNGELTVSGPVSAGESVGPVFHVVCSPCRRHVAIRDVPGYHIPLGGDQS